MNCFQKNLLAFAISATFTTLSAHAEDSASITEALKASKTQLHLRARYESVEQEGTEDADALTLKTRLTFTSGTYNGFGLTLEMDDTTSIGEVDYSDGVTLRGTAVIADPEGTEVNQSFVSYSASWGTLKYGRQRILLDNQRFVGGVGWRQDEQTYDGFSAAFSPAPKLAIFAAYITDVNLIFAEAMDHNQETVLLNASYDFGVVKAIGYGYLIENTTNQALSSDSFGVRLQGKFSDMIAANAEFATQSDAGDNSNNYSATYQLLEVIGTIPVAQTSLSITAGYEVLGSDDGLSAFTTPLATLHAFQGWADKFLAMPNDGVEDMYVGISTKFGPVDTSVVYHDLAADYGSANYGSEVDLVLGGKVGPVGLTLKYADYSADDYLTDTSKFWLMAAMTF